MSAGGVFVRLTSSIGAAAAVALWGTQPGVAGAVPDLDTYPGGPARTVIIPDPKVTGGVEVLRAELPEQWAILEDSEAPATRGFLGYPAGGSSDLPLRFDVAFEGTIEDLKPPIETGCYHHGDPHYPAASIEDVTAKTGDGTGFRKMGDRIAEYRVWQANCPQEGINPQVRAAWLLPEDDIAIYQQWPTKFNDAIVASMQPLR